jgi:hypothetical protein
MEQTILPICPKKYRHLQEGQEIPINYKVWMLDEDNEYYWCSSFDMGINEQNILGFKPGDRYNKTIHKNYICVLDIPVLQPPNEQQIHAQFMSAAINGLLVNNKLFSIPITELSVKIEKGKHTSDYQNRVDLISQIAKDIADNALIENMELYWDHMRQNSEIPEDF